MGDQESSVYKIGQYPKGGPTLRQFLRTARSGVDDDTNYLSQMGGLYYFSQPLDDTNAEEQSEGYDAQIKVGAAGLANKKGARDEAYGGRSETRESRSQLAGRMSMYVGHQGQNNPVLHGLRAMNYGPGTNTKGGARKNFNVMATENAMKDRMAELARQGPNSHPGIKQAKKAYAYDIDAHELDLNQNQKPEWFLVDWEAKDDRGRTPHQRIMEAMGSFPTDSFRPGANSTDFMTQVTKNDAGGPEYLPVAGKGLDIANNPVAPENYAGEVGVMTKSRRDAERRRLILKESIATSRAALQGMELELLGLRTQSDGQLRV